MVAQAKRGENGELIDGGNLEIKAFEILAESLYSYIHRKDIGGSVGVDFGLPKIIDRISFLFGMTDKEKETFATIGRGNIQAFIRNVLNRDINNLQSERGFEIDPITGFYQSGYFDTVSAAMCKVQGTFDRYFNNDAGNVKEPEISIWDIIDYDVSEDELEDTASKENTKDFDEEEEVNFDDDFYEDWALNDIFAKEELKEFKTKLQGIVDDVIVVTPLPDLEGAPTDPIQFRLKEEAAVKAVAEKLVVLHAAYMEFAEDHPWVAEQGLRAFNIALQTLIAGPAGFANSVRGELSGEAINLVAGEYIAAGANAAIEAGAEQLMSRYSSLDKDEARILVASTAIIGAGVAEGSAGMKQILHSVNAKKAGKVEASKLSVDSITSDDVKRYASKLKIMEHEGGIHKGHTSERHVGKNNEWLDKRLVNEPNLRAATSYKDLTSANQVVQEIITHKADDISKWLSEAPIGQRKAFELAFEKDIGYGLRRGEKEIAPRNKAVVVLVKNEKGKFDIITSYPVD